MHVASSSSSSSTMGSAPVGVRRHLDQTLTTFSGHRCLAQLLEWGLSPFDDNVQLFPVRSTPLFAPSILPNISSLIILLLCILHMSPNSLSFMPISFCMMFS